MFIDPIAFLSVPIIPLDRKTFVKMEIFILAWASAWVPQEIGIKNQKCLENLKSEAYFRLIGLILALTAYLPV